MKTNLPNEDYFYEALPFAETHPDHLSALGTLFGLRPAPPERSRVLEIGTASGGNLLPLACSLPDSTFVAMDRAAVSLDIARGHLEAARLGNVVVQLVDIRDFKAEPGSFDYIICHGVYSWMPEDARQATRKAIRELLAPHGIAYLSFNTLPGWFLRGAIRDMLLREVGAEGTEEERLVKARKFLQFLGQHVDQADPTRAWLSNELHLLENLSDHYLVGEHLAAYNHPEYFSDFVRDMDEAGLVFMTDAHLPLMFPERLGEDVAAEVEARGADLLTSQQSLDYLELRYFRRALLCRKDAPLDRRVSADRVFSLVVTSPLLPSSESPSLVEGVAESFSGPSGMISTDRACLKAALVLLSKVAPSGLPFLELAARVSMMLGEVAVTESTRAALARNLLGLSTKGTLRFLGRQRPVASSPGERPKANAWARFQASQGHPIATSLLHEAIQTDSFDRALLSRMDGARSVFELVTAVMDDAAAGRVTVSVDGIACTEREVFLEIAERKLTRLARLGFILR